MNRLTDIFKAFAFPVFPLVPECSYCAAMRWAVMGCLITSLVLGIAVKSVTACMIGGIICAATLVAFLYGVYKIAEEEE